MLKRSIRVALALLACAQGIAQANSEVLGTLRVQQKAPAGEQLPCGALPPGSVSYSHSVSLAALQACSSSRAGPWSATYSPDGSALYVPLFGGGIGAVFPALGTRQPRSSQRRECAAASAAGLPRARWNQAGAPL